jgi:hypothetical protein
MSCYVPTELRRPILHYMVYFNSKKIYFRWTLKAPINLWNKLKWKLRGVKKVTHRAEWGF